jgi:hypothetical protein
MKKPDKEYRCVCVHDDVAPLLDNIPVSDVSKKLESIVTGIQRAGFANYRVVYYAGEEFGSLQILADRLETDLEYKTRLKVEKEAEVRHSKWVLENKIRQEKQDKKEYARLKKKFEK